MASMYNEQLFTFKTLEGDEVKIMAWTYSYSRSWGHKARALGLNLEKHITYYNRTWEAFKYESMLHKIIWALYPNKSDEARRSFMLAQVDAIAQNKREEAEAWLNCFKKTWDALSDKTRATIQKSGIILHSKEQADALIKSAQLLDAVNN